MNASNNIKLLRIEHNLTQEELGEIAGVTNCAVSTWEVGTAEPRMGAVRKMADYFNVSIPYLLGLDKNNPVGLTESELQLLYMFRDLDEGGKENAIEYIQFLIEKRK